MKKKSLIINGMAQIWVKDFVINNYADNPGHIYIGKRNGEGGEFDEKLLSDLIAKFYDKYF